MWPRRDSSLANTKKPAQKREEVDMNQKIRKLASEITRKESPFAYQISNLLFFPNRKNILLHYYAYFRWADDQVDNVTFPINEIQLFIKRQKNLITSWYEGNTVKPLTIFEEMAFVATQEDIYQGKQLKNMVVSFLDALDWDVQRKHKITNQMHLNRYSFLLGNSYAEGLLYGLGLNPLNPDYLIPKVLCGIAAHRAHILRDLKIDIKLGYLNIPVEEFETFSIQLGMPWMCSSWIKQKVAETKRLFVKGLKNKHRLPSMRSQLVFYLYCQKYIHALEEVLVHFKTGSVIEIPEMNLMQNLQ